MYYVKKNKLKAVLFSSLFFTLISSKSTFAKEDLADVKNYPIFSTIIYDTLKRYFDDMDITNTGKMFDYGKPFSSEDFPQLFSMHLDKILDNSKKIEILEAKVKALHKQLQGMEDMVQMLRQQNAR